MRFEPYLGTMPGPDGQTEEAHFYASPTFTGSGAEYFRIWIVNLTLTIATLGIYSAWAKVRRQQYFYRNTQLGGASFDFTGDPKTILRGRIVAILLLAAWNYAFGFSIQVGIVVVAVLLLGLPWLMRSALRFRLSNTVYRGLPFGFDGGVSDAYWAYFPPVAVLLLPGVIAALLPDKRFAGGSGALYLLWPLMHAAMRRYQHRNLMYGDQHAAFDIGKRELAGPYVRLGFIVLGMLILLSLPIMMLGNVLIPKLTYSRSMFNILIVLVATISTLFLIYMAIVSASLYTTVRVDNLAWTATSFPGVNIVCDMELGSYARLQTVNVLLTVLTLGLYRPFAAVRTWRYRMAHILVSAPEGLERATLLATRPAVAAAGDGAADFLGLDISW